MVENYTLAKADWVKDGLLAKTITRAFMVDDILPGKQANKRVNPLAIAAFAKREHVIELAVKDRRLWSPDDIDKKVGEISFTRKSTRMGDGVRMVYALDTGTSDTVSADKAEDVYALSTLINDELGMEFYLDKSPRPSTEAPGVDQAVIGPHKADLARIVELSQKGDEASAVAALGLTNGILAKLPHPRARRG
jgi:hypothetical protein